MYVVTRNEHTETNMYKVLRGNFLSVLLRKIT